MARILLLNQCFYPDHVSTAQHLTDLALALRDRGHEVWVVASSRAYDNPSVHYKNSEEWRGVHITRIGSPGLGKKSILLRIVDSIGFWLSAAIRVFSLARPDLVICLTSPPMISVLGGLVGRLRGARLVHWVMDLNPDEAVAAGLIRENSLLEALLQRLLVWSFKEAQLVIALDRFMEQRLLSKGLRPSAIYTAPPWSHDDAVNFNQEARTAFRARHRLAGKFVVMYSGNHSPCHPLQTILDAARQLSSDDSFHFAFIGGGSGFPIAKQFVEKHGLKNFLFLPYQPLPELSGSLSSADLHIVAMGDPFVGIVHPCKIYNIMHLGVPFLFVGPQDSHLGDLSRELGNPTLGSGVDHGDVAGAVTAIRNFQAAGPEVPSPQLQDLSARFASQQLMSGVVTEVERLTIS